MSATRFRRIARLERLAELYLEWKSGIEKEWQRILGGAAAHAAVLAFLIRYGNPQLGEPLEWAIKRCAEATAWKEHCNELLLEPISKSPEEDNEAGELDEAEKVVGVVFPADEDATLPLYPGEEALSGEELARCRTLRLGPFPVPPHKNCS